MIAAFRTKYGTVKRPHLGGRSSRQHQYSAEKGRQQTDHALLFPGISYVHLRMMRDVAGMKWK